METWETKEDVTFEVDGLVTSVNVSIISGAIDVVSTDGPTRIEIRDVTFSPVKVSLDNGELRIEQIFTGFPFKRGQVSATISIAIPSEARADINSISADATIAGMTGRVTVKSLSGALTLDDLGGGVKATAVSGNIELRRAGGIVELHATSGDVTVMSGALEAFTLNTVSGNATLDLTPAPGSRMSANSVSGDVLMRTPFSDYASVELASVTGSLHTSGETPFEVTKGPGSNRASFADGVGSASFTGRTVSGAITLIDHL